MINANASAARPYFGPVGLTFLGLLAASGWATINRWAMDGQGLADTALKVAVGLAFLAWAVRGPVICRRAFAEARWATLSFALVLTIVGMGWNGLTDWRYFSSAAHSASADVRAAQADLDQALRDLAVIEDRLEWIDGADASALQAWLARQGHPLVIDGRIGAGTAAALAQEREDLAHEQGRLQKAIIPLTEAARPGAASSLADVMLIALVASIELTLFLTPFILEGAAGTRTQTRAQATEPSPAESDDATEDGGRVEVPEHYVLRNGKQVKVTAHTRKPRGGRKTA